MIVIFRREKVLLISLIFLLSITLYSLKLGTDSNAIEATNESTMQRTVILDAGHGGEDPGAVSDYSGLEEKNVNLNIALKARQLLEAENFKVIMTRQEDVLQYREGTPGYTKKRMQDLLTRKSLIDESGADIVVSIHLNKFQQEQYYGAQAFFPPKSTESKKLAICIQDALRETVDPQNKRKALVKSNNLIILKDLKVPTAIVECGFLSNAEDDKKLATEEYQNKIALAIKEGVKKYFGN